MKHKFMPRAAVAAVSLVLADCGSPSPAPSAPAIPGGPASAALEDFAGGAPGFPVTAPLLYAVNSNVGAVSIYEIKSLRHNPAPIAKITAGLSFPFGLARDDVSGDLYISDINIGAVLIFPKGQTTSSGRITKGIFEPIALSLSPSRELWVSNDSSSVTVYQRGQKAPLETITGFGCPFGSAFDASGDFFVADFCNLQVYEVPKGTSVPIALHLSGPAEPIGVTIDGAGDLWVSDGAGAKVYVYTPGSTTPFKTISTFSLPYMLSTDRAGQVFVSDIGANDVVEFAPGSYTPQTTLTNGVSGPVGVLARP